MAEHKKYRLQNPRLFARTEFEKACNKLGNYNLTDLWMVSSLLSSIEYFGTFGNEFNPLFPMLNSEKIDMFNKAILSSSSRNYKEKAFTSEHLAFIFNRLINATYTDELNDESKGAQNRILNFFAKKANSQFKYNQFNLQILIARAFALYSDITVNFKFSQEEKCIKISRYRNTISF